MASKVYAIYDGDDSLIEGEVIQPVMRAFERALNEGYNGKATSEKEEVIYAGKIERDTLAEWGTEDLEG